MEQVTPLLTQKPFYTLGKLPPNSRIWIYQSSAPLATLVQEKISAVLESFCATWESHGTPLQAGFEICKNQFVVIGVNQSHTEPSGCAIDKSVAVIRQIEQDLNLQLLNRDQLAFENGNQILLVPLAGLKNAIASGFPKADTRLYNNQVPNLAQWHTNWLVPAKHTWLAKYFRP